MQGLNLSGTYKAEPRTAPLSCIKPQQPTMYIFANFFCFDYQDPDVGTFRAPLSLSALVRILTRLLGPRNEANDNEEFTAMWKSQASFCNTLNYAYGDVVLDNRALFTVVQVCHYQTKQSIIIDK